MKKIYLIGLIFFFASCNGLTSRSDAPSTVLKTFLKAKIDKDAAAQKKLLSESSLKFLEETAKKQNTTVDQLLIDDAGMKLMEIPEIGKEEINNDTATVELKNPNTGAPEKMPFVKENGNWKIALDKAFEEAMKKIEQLMKQMPSKPDGNSAVVEPNKKTGKEQK